MAPAQAKHHHRLTPKPGLGGRTAAQNPSAFSTAVPKQMHGTEVTLVASVTNSSGTSEQQQDRAGAPSDRPKAGEANRQSLFYRKTAKKGLISLGAQRSLPHVSFKIMLQNPSGFITLSTANSPQILLPPCCFVLRCESPGMISALCQPTGSAQCPATPAFPPGLGREKFHLETPCLPWQKG